MKKFALMIAVAFCFPVVGLTGCGGGSGDNTVADVQPEAPEMTEEEQAAFDAAMDADAQQ